MVQYVWEKTAENLSFVENISFIRKSSEAAVNKFPGKYPWRGPAIVKLQDLSM